MAQRFLYSEDPVDGVPRLLHGHVGGEHQVDDHALAVLFHVPLDDDHVYVYSPAAPSFIVYCEIALRVPALNSAIARLIGGDMGTGMMNVTHAAVASRITAAE